MSASRPLAYSPMLLQVDHKPAYVYTGTKPIVPGQRAIMFVHGAANDHSVWTLQSRYFAYHGFNVLAVDLPGHGKSGGPPLATVEDMAGWATQLLDAAGIQKAALVGHSMGSLIALEAAARHPDRVEKLALIGGSMRLLERTAAPLYSDFNACNQYGAGADSAAKITCPVLMIAGSRDQM